MFSAHVQTQEAKQVTQPLTTGGGFAELLHAMLSQDETAPITQNGTTKLASAEQPAKARALGDVTNMPACSTASGRKSLAAAAIGKASIAPESQQLLQ